MSTNQIQLRNAFKGIKAAYAAAERNPIITPSTLRLEVAIKQNVTGYKFYVLTSETNPSFNGGSTNTELRLNQNDTFWGVLAGLYLAKPASETDAEYKKYSYANPAEFGAAAPAYDIFHNNCSLDIAINNVQYIQKFSTGKFRWVGQAQQGLGAASVDDGGDPVASTSIDEFYGNETGVTALGTLIEFSGQKKNDVVLNVPTGLSVAPGAYDRLILEFSGFLALNAALR